MQIAFHIGANCTDEDRLLKSILKNADVLLQEGIAVPGPSRYRRLLRETIQNLGSEPPAPDTRDILIDAIVENDNISRVVLSNDNFICIPKRIFDHGVFYPQAETKVRGLHRLFPDDDISLFLGIRNPVTFLQETFQRADAGDLDTYLGFMRPEELRWSEVIRRIKAGAPDTPLTVWCYEDSPLLWEQLIRHQCGAQPETLLGGGLDLLSGLITQDGMRELQQTLLASPPDSDAARHDVIADIWEVHGVAEATDYEVGLIDLAPDLIDHLTDLYDRDVEAIDQMEGVTLLLPFR
ncbi:MAG: hypothetical protein AAFY14_02530 [Pseudomonadota bacterium]